MEGKQLGPSVLFLQTVVGFFFLFCFEIRVAMLYLNYKPEHHGLGELG